MTRSNLDVVGLMERLAAAGHAAMLGLDPRRSDLPWVCMLDDGPLIYAADPAEAFRLVLAFYDLQPEIGGDLPTDT